MVGRWRDGKSIPGKGHILKSQQTHSGTGLVRCLEHSELWGEELG